MNTENNKQQNYNPWKGLNFYTEGEILYGRDEEIQSLSLYIINNTQSVLYGKSGIGKSSIIQAGIFPIARTEGLLPISIRLSHNDTQSYIEQIKARIQREVVNGQLIIQEQVPRVTNHDETLWEYFHRHTFGDPQTNSNKRLLIVFDQFEEIFTLQHDEKNKLAFFAELADLLNEVTPQYIIDMLNQDEQQQGSQDSLKKNGGKFVLDLKGTSKQELPNYSYKSLFNIVFVIREDFLSHLERYTKYIPVMKTNRFALLPLNEEQAADIILKPIPGLVSKDVATLIIQKVTQRSDFRLDRIPEIEVDAAILSLFLNRLYAKLKTEEEIFTTDLVNQLGSAIIRDFYEEAVADLPQDEIEELEDQLLTYDGRRNNISYKDLLREGISEEVLYILTEKRKILRRFNYQDDDRVEFMHDVLCPIINDRIEFRDLKKTNEKEQLLKKRYKNRIRLAISALIFIVAFWLGWQKLFNWEYSEFYDNFTTLNGWPVGIGEQIFKQDRKNITSEYYKLTRNGYLPFRLSSKLNAFTRVEVIGLNGEKTTNKFIETPVVGLLESELDDNNAQKFAILQKKTATWEYIPDKNMQEITRQDAYDLEGNLLYSIQFIKDNTRHSQDDNKYLRWAVFYDKDGNKMRVTDNGIDRMRQNIKNGLVTGCLFYTEIGSPQTNAFGAYGYEYIIDSLKLEILARYNVDRFGYKIDSTEFAFYDYQHGHPTRTSLFDIIYLKSGVIIYKFPDFCDTLSFNKNGTLGAGAFHIFGGKYSKIRFQYDEFNRIMLRQKFLNETLVHSEKYTYSNNFNSDPEQIERFSDSQTFIEKHEIINDSTTAISFWKDGKAIVTQKTNEFGHKICYHKVMRMTSTNRPNHKTYEIVNYLDSLEKPIPRNNGIYASYSIIRDSLNNVKLKYFYNTQGDIYKSAWYDYDEYGNMIACAVAGVDETPVRCLNWSWDNLCYYKMAVTHPFNNNNVFVAANGINEFNEPSYLTRHNYIYSINEVPYTIAIDSTYMNTPAHDKQSLITSIAIAKTVRTEVKNQPFGLFVHILAKAGTLYKTGLQDGDVIIYINNRPFFPLCDKSFNTDSMNLLLENGGRYTIARVDETTNEYCLHDYNIPVGSPQSEIIKMALTPREKSRLDSVRKKSRLDTVIINNIK